ncbi:RmlC-like cupin domain-containing protein [Podospora aff. communis PSN243]|uniref:RmlC-like cupin domain-containing protein n=1 Tax=Podospora aff. communis PSN243 TaxID=3040156 RepID=A0AAV9GFL7_9PEZI|nr:RmlC-like cupin domain-containing protein [Podospora aff. communis PSN243]
MGTSTSKRTKPSPGAQPNNTTTPISSQPSQPEIQPTKTIPTLLSPKPTTKTPYLLPQLHGESLTIPGSKGTFRVLTSSSQQSTNPSSTIAVFTSSSVAAPAPGFHYHTHTHDIFLVTRGSLQLWNGSKCRVMRAGDFAYVPPGVVHNPLPLGPYTETLGLVAPGDWVDFFRQVGEEYGGVVLPEGDERDLGAWLGGRMKDVGEVDVHFVRGYEAPAVGEWEEGECVLPPGRGEGYFLRADSGPRWMLGGVMSRPFICAAQCEGRFAISSIESSCAYGEEVFGGVFLRFAEVDHCFFVLEGELRVLLEGGEWTAVHGGQSVFVSAGWVFKLAFGSRYVRVVSFANGEGLETIVHEAGEKFEGYVLPDEVEPVDRVKLKSACAKLGVTLS